MKRSIYAKTSKPLLPAQKNQFIRSWPSTIHFRKSEASMFQRSPTERTPFFGDVGRQAVATNACRDASLTGVQPEARKEFDAFAESEAHSFPSSASRASILKLTTPNKMSPLV
jgi:hypothetical protein